jgi:hypothetical protein
MASVRYLHCIYLLAAGGDPCAGQVLAVLFISATGLTCKVIYYYRKCLFCQYISLETASKEVCRSSGTGNRAEYDTDMWYKLLEPVTSNLEP